MEKSTLNQWIIQTTDDDYLDIWIDAFLIDRKAKGLSTGTLGYYQLKLNKFSTFCETHIVKRINEISPHLIREFLVFLSSEGHNPGGVHGFYRALRTFLYWWESEVEPDNWKNPIRKVRAPKVPKEIIQPISLTDIKAMIDTCENSFLGTRDKAILLCLLDTGVRASELCEMDSDNLDRITTSILIKFGKGGKQRTVFLGKKSRKAIRKVPKGEEKHL